MLTSPDGKALIRSSLFAMGVLLGTTAVATLPSTAFALSELREIPGEPPADESQATTPDDDSRQALELPMPDPLIRKGGETITQPVIEEPATDDAVVEEPDAPVDVIYDISKAPAAVRRMRELIVEAAASGDIERLRPLLGKGLTETQVSIVETDEDPVATLKGLSGDNEGIEVLAILLDVLATGFVLKDAGTPEEIYVWPYFTEKPLTSLTPPEKIELLRIVTAGDFADMQEFGGYNFYRVGITPDGQWKFFVTGD
jgi:hypothetical protein